MDTRRSLYAGLLKAGVRASLPAAFQPEQSIGAGKSLGFIEVDLGPLRWINVRRLSEGASVIVRCVLGVPDMRLPRFPEIERLSIEARPDRSPAARWGGEDLGLGIIEALNRHPSLQEELPPTGRIVPALDAQRGDQRFLIHAHPEQRCWTLSFPVETTETSILGFFGGRRLRVPRAAELEAYQEIGRVLLNSRLSNYWESGEPVSA